MLISTDENKHISVIFRLFHLFYRRDASVCMANLIMKNIFVYVKEVCTYVEFGDTFTVIKQTSTGFNDRTAKSKKEFVPLLQPVIIQVIDNSTWGRSASGINL